ncbi:MAG: hypothetical protein U0230_22715 [Polyangiales bacterium]
MSRRLSSVLAVLAALSAGLSAESPGRAEPPSSPWIFPVRFHFPWSAGEGPLDVDDVEAELERANAIFASAGIAFAPSRPEVRHGTDVPRAARTRDERDALVRLGSGPEIHVFVVEELFDVDEAGRRRMGVHWRVRGDVAKHGILLASYALPTVLAHELGHYFGNPHSHVPDDLMSYVRTGTRPPFLSAGEIRRARTSARRYATSGELRVLTGARSRGSERPSPPGSRR